MEIELLKKERERASFDVEEMINILDGGKEATLSRRQFEKIWMADEKLRVPYVADMTREERFVDSVKRSTHLFTNFLKKNNLKFDCPEFEYGDRCTIAEYCFGLHFGAFIPCIYSFGSDEQIRKWAPVAEELGIIGAYAQTELGHGSNLRELETTVEYDRVSGDFIVNSPKITSAKWWPGDMGLLANHVVLMSNLYMDGNNMGMHPFIVQTRDLGTHEPLPGVRVGDIGAKMAFETIDNGYLKLDRVRVPRSNLLCRNAEVTKEGRYVRHTSDRMMYASMSRLRVILIKRVILSKLSKACTIAVRYSCVRRQGAIDKSEGEVAIMEHMLQQHKLLPGLAAAYAIHFASDELTAFYEQVTEQIQRGDLTRLPEMHVLSASMKAWSSDEAVHACEVLRRACGGHGYSNASGLPRLYLSLLPSVTYEGENTVMYLQVARFLLKCSTQIGTGALAGTRVAYLDEDDADFQLKRGNCRDLAQVVRAFKKRSRASVLHISGKIRKGMEEGGETLAQVGNYFAPELVRTAKAFVVEFMVSSFARRCAALCCSEQSRDALNSLCLLYALHHINHHQGEFLNLKVLMRCCGDCMRTAEKETMEKVRGNAVALVDAFDYRDEALQSCIGAYDGDVYPRLFETAVNSPMNRNRVHQASYEIIRPHLLEGKRRLEAQPSKL